MAVPPIGSQCTSLRPQTTITESSSKRNRLLETVETVENNKARFPPVSTVFHSLYYWILGFAKPLNPQMRRHPGNSEPVFTPVMFHTY